MKSFKNQRTSSIWLILAILPMAILLAVIIYCYVDVPHFDSWAMVPLLEKSFSGRLTFMDFASQHNEHRMLFPKLLMVWLARLTSWDSAYELAANIIFGTGIFAVLALQIGMTKRRLAVYNLHWVIPILSIIVFSVCQSENWLWGWQLALFMGVFASVTAIILLANPDWRPWKPAAALGLEILALYSFSAGMLVWPIGIILLSIMPQRDGENRRKTFAFWALAGLLPIIIYLLGYQKPPNYPSIATVFHKPADFTGYLLAYLGNPAVPHIPQAAIAAGLFAIILFFWAIRTLGRRGIGYEYTAPYLGMGLFSIAGAVITSVARSGFGIQQALCSRYITIANLIWVSIVVLLFLLAAVPGKSACARHTGKAPIILIWIIIWIITTIMFIHSMGGIKGAVITKENLLTEKGNILKENYQGLPADMIDVLKQRHLSLFRSR